MRTSKFSNDPCFAPGGGSPRIMLSPAESPPSSFISKSASCTSVVKKDLRLLAEGCVLFGKGLALCCASFWCWSELCAAETSKHGCVFFYGDGS